jgi:catechol 2,3-dioxygenase-like lactoylglutathione lyase family enzyme
MRQNVPAAHAALSSAIGPPAWRSRQFLFTASLSGDQNMKPRITLITLGVADLAAAVRFYRDGLGLHTEGIIGQEFEHGAVAFFDLQNGLKLALWPRASIAHDTGLPPAAPGSGQFTLGHNVAARTEVDDVMRQAAQAGAQIVKPAAETFWGGYAGYFRDPDQHLWEVAWNPAMLPPEAAK